MKLFRVIIPVTDIDKAVEFYDQVLNIAGKRVSAGRHYYNCGGTILACFDPKADGDDFELQPNPDYIYLSVTDIDETYRLVQQSDAAFVGDAIRDRPWGERSFYAKDPFGNPICFVDEKTVFMG